MSQRFPFGVSAVAIVMASFTLAVAPAIPAAHAPEFAWTRQFGTIVSDFAHSVAVDFSWVYVAGATSGTFPGQTNVGSSDAFVRKYDGGAGIAGTEIWTHQFGTSAFDEARAVAVDASGVYVAGNTFGTLPGQTTQGGLDAFVQKYDGGLGTELWTRQFGTAGDDLAYAVALDASGVYVAGVTLYNGDTFVRKYDAIGTELWTRQFGTAGGVVIDAVAADASGIYVAGYTGGTLPGQTNAGSSDAFVRKYDAIGTELWTHQFGTAGGDLAYAVALDASGVYVAGATSGTFPGQTSEASGDAFVRKYDGAGNILWTRQFGTTDSDSASALAADISGVYVAGVTSGTLPGQTGAASSSDAFVRKYDGAGNILWTRQFGTPGTDFATAVAVGGSDPSLSSRQSGVYVAGYTDGMLPGQTSAGGVDAFATKLWRLGEIDASPGLADFGGVEVGSSSTRSVVIRNLGDGVLRVEGISLASGSRGFTIASAPATPFTLRPGMSADAVIAFAPPAMAPFADAVRITSDDANRGLVELLLRGIGVDTTPPVLVLSAPTETLTRNSAISVAGTTEPNATVTVNGAPVAVDPTGSFVTAVTLTEGPNTITVVARDAQGNTASTVRIVVRDWTPSLEQDLAATRGTLSLLLLIVLIAFVATGAAQFAMYRRLKKQLAGRPPAMPPPGGEP